MKNNKTFLFTLISSVLFFGILGTFVGPTIFSEKTTKENHENHNLGAEIAQPTNLQEALYGVDVIIQGTVKRIDPVEKRDNGLQGKFNDKYDVTPAIITVSDTVYGNNPESDEIIFLQHGIENEVNADEFVHEGDTLLLMLTKTTDGKYWSYNFDDGIWKLKNGSLQSNTENPILEKFNNSDLKKFKAKIMPATESQMKVVQ
ncbi:hypothetical protein [Paenibacillus sp. HW567]|uniref:hypothetical protein n=1 Tax=Paenibacillus sp. HW567 TaxID=1034769 RepID=UPI00038102A5|nr:hypothetical protein [Paenibacillus sp. HW567]